MNNKSYHKVFIRKDQRVGTNEACYTAYIPEFGIVADGDTLENALDNINATFQFHVECLTEEGENIPISNQEDNFVFDTSIELPLRPTAA